MKSTIPILIFLFLVFSAKAQKLAYHNVNTIDFDSLIAQNNGTLLDVRTENEFKNQHLADAGQLNFYALDFRKRLLLLSKDEPIYLYCNTGYRSEIAAEILAENGYTKVYNLEKGIMDWNVHEMPTITEPDAKKDTEHEMSVENYQKTIQSDTLVFIDFYAPWCAPCRKMMPIIDSLKTEYHGIIKIEKINVDASKQLVKELKLGSVPYFALYRNGALLEEKYGYITRDEIMEYFKKHE
jgi:thioredoxin